MRNVPFIWSATAQGCWLVILTLLAFVPMTTGIAFAAQAPAEASTVGSASGHVLSRADLEAFFSGIVPISLARGDIAGSAIIVVQNGKIVFEKAYGYSDVATKKAFSVDDTLDRMGSISKLFTWTALMQLVEQGRVKLDADVNDYLDFHFPERCGKITIRDLLTHTAGFEEVAKDLYYVVPHKLVPIGDYVKTHVPGCIFAPGTVIAYSNYGATLAGYIVERVSGLSFPEYIQKNIFARIGMSHSTFVQPLPGRLRQFMSSGYGLASEPAGREELIQVSPAGGLWSSAGDMAKFMMAHLNGGAFAGGRILEPATTNLMHAHQISAAPGFNGMALGFYEMSRNGYRVISHAGDTNLYHNALYLILGSKTGLFLTFNSRGTGGDAAESLDEAIYRAFMDRYFPANRLRTETATADQNDDARYVAGNYIVSRRSETTFMRLSNVLSSGWQFEVSANPDGTIITTYFPKPDGEAQRWKEVAPLLYKAVDGPDRMIFVRNSRGRISQMTTDADLPVYESEPVSWSENRAWVEPLIETIVLIFSAMLFAMPAAAVVRRRKVGGNIISTIALWPWVTIWTWCLLDLVLLYSWYRIVTGPRISPALSPSLDPWLCFLYALGWLSISGSIFAFYFALRSLFSANHSPIKKAGLGLTALAGIGFVWILVSFNLLNFAFSY